MEPDDSCAACPAIGSDIHKQQASNKTIFLIFLPPFEDIYFVTTS